MILFLINFLFFSFSFLILFFLYKKRWILEGKNYYNAFFIILINGFSLAISENNYTVYLIVLAITSFMISKLLLSVLINKDTYILFMSIGKTKFEYLKYMILKSFPKVIVDFSLFSLINSGVYFISVDIYSINSTRWRYYTSLYSILFLALSLVYFFKIYSIRKNEN